MATSHKAKLSLDVDAILKAPDRAALEAIVLKFAVVAFPSDPTGLAESTSALIALEAVCDAHRAKDYPSNSSYQVASDLLMDLQREWFERTIEAVQAKGRNRLAKTSELVMQTNVDSA